MTIDNLLSKLEKVKKNKNGWMARCPCPPHADKNPSLSISVKGNKILMNCFAKCNYEDILAKIGLTKNDLYLDSPSANNGNGKANKIEAIYPYTDKTGDLIYEVIRFEGKRFSQRRPDGSGGYIRNLENVDRVLFHLPRIVEAVADKRDVFIVEGERDVLSLEKIGLVATTASGGAAVKWRRSYNNFLEDTNIILLPDNDSPGLRHMFDVAESLHKTVESIRIITLPGLGRGEDVSDWLRRGGTREELLKLVNECKIWELSDMPQPESDNGRSKHDDLEFTGTDTWTAHFLRKNFGEDIRYNHSSKMWQIWRNGRWKPDSKNQIMQFAEENVNRIWDLMRKMPLYDGSLQNKKREEAAKWAKKSESLKYMINTLSLAKSLEDIAVEQSDFDNNPYLFNLKNGTFDLENDNFYPHKQSDNLSKMSGVTFDEKATCKFWFECLDLWFGSDPELIKFVQTAIGYSLCEKMDEEILFYIQGESGKNGKSRLPDLFSLIFGDYFLMSDPALVFKRRFQSPDNYFIPSLAGRRLVCVPELGKKHSFDCELAKKHTGGEKIAARQIYGSVFEFVPSYALWLCGNHLPKVGSGDEAFWRRMHRIPMNIQIPPDQRKPQSEMLRNFREELPGIFNWILAGYKDRRDFGMVVPGVVKSATQEYRSDADFVGNFKEECIEVVRESKTTVKDVFEKFKAWCEECNERKLSRKELSKALQEHGFEAPKPGTGGKYFWKNLVLKENT